MAHGLAGVKEMGLASFAERFAAAGFVTLAFDYRYWGESEGEPRSQIFPLEMIEDYRNGITWLSNRPAVDPQRIGVWGTSHSGGLFLYVGTFDKRVKAVVAQVPSTVNPESRRALDPQEVGPRWRTTNSGPNEAVQDRSCEIHEGGLPRGRIMRFAGSGILR